MKNTYKDVDDYFETFEPLLFEEVKAQILQNQDPEEEGFHPFFFSKIVYKSKVVNIFGWHSFFLLAASGSELRLVMECSEADGFHILQVTDERERVEDDNKVNKYKSLGPNDLLLLSKEEVSLYLSDNSFHIVLSECWIVS